MRRVLTQRRIGWACAVATSALMASLLTAAAAGASVYGGATAQDFPVVIETSKNGRKVVEATIAIRLTCTSGGAFSLPDGYRNMSVSKKRKFSASFGPVTNRNDDGTTTDYSGSISGAFNKARTNASGKWSLKATDHDAAGTITDTCESGSISWRAKQ